jgi:hypothetical protein
MPPRTTVHTPPIKKDGLPYFSAKWLAGLLAGENSCRFSPWLRSRYTIDKEPSSFDFVKWRIEHSALLSTRHLELKAAGYQVALEGQNAFKLKGNTAIVSGKPDIVGRKPGEFLVSDAKSGVVRDSNTIQVAIYMLILPMYLGQPDLKPTGEVVYKSAILPVTWADAETIRTPLFQLIKELATADVAPEPVPSFNECSFCEVTKNDCPMRFGEGDKVDVMTSEF